MRKRGTNARAWFYSQSFGRARELEQEAEANFAYYSGATAEEIFGPDPYQPKPEGAKTNDQD